jgi:hypothetical protein
MSNFNETACDYLSCDKHATFCSSETKWINKILKLAEQYPDEVEIQVLPENNQGMILAHVPKNWFKLAPKHKREMTDEQREDASKRMKEMLAKKYSKNID